MFLEAVKKNVTTPYEIATCSYDPYTTVTHSSRFIVTHHIRSIVTNFHLNTSPLRWSFGGNKKGYLSDRNCWPPPPFGQCFVIFSPTSCHIGVILPFYKGKKGENLSQIVSVRLEGGDRFRFLYIFNIVILPLEKVQNDQWLPASVLPGLNVILVSMRQK